MSDLTLAQLSMLSLYSAMGVFTLAMIGYAVYLSGLMPARTEARSEAQPERVLVSVGGPGLGHRRRRGARPTMGRAPRLVRVGVGSVTTVCRCALARRRAWPGC